MRNFSTFDLDSTKILKLLEATLNGLGRFAKVEIIRSEIVRWLFHHLSHVAAVGCLRHSFNTNAQYLADGLFSWLWMVPKKCKIQKQNVECQF